MFRRYCDHLFPYAALALGVCILADVDTRIVGGLYATMLALICAAHWPQK